MRLSGKVAFITGAAQGLGRSHAIRLAQEGANVSLGDARSPDDPQFAKTVELVVATGRQVLANRADVCSESDLEAAARGTFDRFGRLDIVVANAGVFPRQSDVLELAEHAWQKTIDVNLSGMWRTVRAALPYMRAGQRGGSIILTSSLLGLKATGRTSHYVASKHGVVGLMKSLAIELGPEYIRVNSIHPTTVNTSMLQSVMPDLATDEERAAALRGFNVLPVPWIEPEDVSNAIVFLASDEARYITGVALPVDAGALLQ